MPGEMIPIHKIMIKPVIYFWSKISCCVQICMCIKPMLAVFTHIHLGKLLGNDSSPVPHEEPPTSLSLPRFLLMLRYIQLLRLNRYTVSCIISYERRELFKEI